MQITAEIKGTRISGRYTLLFLDPTDAWDFDSDRHIIRMLLASYWLSF